MSSDDFSYNNNLLKMSHEEFVESTETSVRLRNCIAKAFSDGNCPFLTIEEYLKAGNSISKMLRLPNFGRKTAHELDSFIRNVTRDFTLNESMSLTDSQFDNIDESDFLWKGEKLDDKCLEQNLYELIEDYSTSVRLKNCFERFYNDENFPCRTIKDFLVGGNEVINKLLRYEHFGRKSAKELEKLVESFICKRGNDSQEDSSYKGLTELIYELCEQLKPIENEVLSYRYGFDNAETRTLEEIANQIGVTRERIRQIEAKGFRKLNLKSNRNQLLNVLAHNKIKIFDSLADGHGVVWKRGMSKLPGEYRLAFDITHGSFSNWIESIAVEFSAGWLRSDLMTPEFVALQIEIRDALPLLQLPAPLALLVKMLDEDVKYVKLCVSLLDEVRLFDGLIFPKHLRLGRRKQRQARLYDILQSSDYLQLDRLVDKHNELFPNVQCSTRDAQIVMSDAPQLFITLNDYGWAALGLKTPIKLLEDNNFLEMANSADNEELESDEEVSGKMVSAIKSILEVHGPLHFVPLRELFIETFGDIYASTSFGPVLITYKDFVRLAPGIYGLKSHLCLEVSLKYKELLFTETDCSLYVLARWAGEPMYTYPWWNPTMEYEMCKWSQRENNGSLFSSLLAVAEPNNWLVKDDELLHWLELKRRNAHYSFQFPHKHSLAACLPTLRDLYAVMVVADNQCSMNWIRINRILGHRMNDQYAATYLAVLISLGALESTDHWQMQHLPGKRLSELIKELSIQLCKQSDINWSSDLGNSYLQDIDHATSYSTLGWVEIDELRTLLDSYTCCNLSSQKFVPTINEYEPTYCSLEHILNEKMQIDKHERFADLIDELMSDGYSGE